LEEGCAVGADGSLYNVSLLDSRQTTVANLQKYPNFANRVHEALVDIFGEKGKKIVTHHAEDGSGVGSAIIAGKSHCGPYANLQADGSHDESTKTRGNLCGLLNVTIRV
jgi:hexokinase